MSAIIDRAVANTDRFRAKLTEDLATKPLAAMLRRETWGDHDRAQYSPFEMSLAQGTITKAGYAELVANVYGVYKALEERIVELKDDPMVGQFHIDELARLSFLAKDLETFYGADWINTMPAPLECTVEYIDRIRSVGPVGYIAHHYTRYMADLSGGLMIYMALKKVWETDEGLAYYDFSAVGDPVGFKNAYREALNSLPLDVPGKLELIQEVMVAYEFNIEMGSELERKHLTATSA